MGAEGATLLGALAFDDVAADGGLDVAADGGLAVVAEVGLAGGARGAGAAFGIGADLAATEGTGFFTSTFG